MNLTDVLLAIAGPPAYGAVYWLLTRLARRFFSRVSFSLSWISGGVGFSIADILQRQWLALIFASANIVLAVFLWWLSRRRRKRARHALGAKSRTLRDALVRRTREAAQPRPVLRPVPGGAR